MRHLRSIVVVALAAAVCLAAGAVVFRQDSPPRVTGSRRVLDVDGPRVTERWRAELAADVVGLPATDDSGVVVTAGLSQVVALSPLGKVDWKTSFDGALARAPRLDAAMVYVAGARNVAALRRATGEVVWRVPTALDGEDNRANRPVVVGGVVVVTTAKGLALGLDAATGVERWRVTLPTATTAEPAGAIVGAGVPMVAIVGVGQWWGIDASTGSQLWRRDTGLFGTSSPVVYTIGDTALAALASNEVLMAVNARTGEVAWQVPAEQSEYFQVPVVSGDGAQLLVPDHWGRVVAYDAANGQRVWDVDAPDAVAEFGEPVLVGERLVALPLDADGPRLATPDGSVPIKPPAEGHGVARLGDRGLVVTTWGGRVNYVVLYHVESGP